MRNPVNYSRSFVLFSSQLLSFFFLEKNYLEIYEKKTIPSVHLEIIQLGTSLVVQWLRICLPTQGTRVRALVQEDPTCRGATKPVCHNY